MRGQIPLGRVRGVEIELHYTWFIIALLITVSLVGQFRFTNPDWSAALVWGSAIVTGLLFFATLILHELAHSLVAVRQGLPVRSITLFALGGVSQIEHDAMTPGGEFWMAIAGPITSFVIGGICLAIATATGWSTGVARSPVPAVLGWLGYINLALGAFNMIPGFPLDGGRVLRSIIWRATHDAVRATRIAAWTGQVVAWVFIAWGLLRFLAGASFGGLWIALIGWFLLAAARASLARADVAERLRDLHVGDFTIRDCERVDVGTSLSVVAARILAPGVRCYVAEEDGRAVGVVGLAELRAVPRGQWSSTTVGTAMRRLEQLPALSPDTPAVEGLEAMLRASANQLPVVASGRLQGIVSRRQILEVIESRRTAA